MAKISVVELDPARVPVLLVAGVADLRVFLVTLNTNGPVPIGFWLMSLGLPTGQQLLGVFGGQDRRRSSWPGSG
ncbi:hypothetical protein [Pseudomonas peli]|uniref:hypothetical protein n=1 Tax=Pseudomonas peli TaxID=592361 RepID=UPI0024AD317B|nr:hypothetical protein [Pseudomonas peli]